MQELNSIMYNSIWENKPDKITRGPWALMRSHEFNGQSHLFFVKFTFSDPLGGPLLSNFLSGKISK